MGYYTETHFKFRLSKETPNEVIDLLENVFSDNKMLYYAELLEDGDSTKDAIKSSLENNTGLLLSVANTPNLPIDHPFGKCHRWDQFLYGSFNKDTMKVIINSDIKAYDGEPFKFLHWLSPYIIKSRRKKGTYLGWTKGEDAGQIHHYLEKVLTEHFAYRDY